MLCWASREPAFTHLGNLGPWGWKWHAAAPRAAFLLFGSMAWKIARVWLRARSASKDFPVRCLQARGRGAAAPWPRKWPACGFGQEMPAKTFLCDACRPGAEVLLPHRPLSGRGPQPFCPPLVGGGEAPSRGTTSGRLPDAMPPNLKSRGSGN